MKQLFYLGICTLLVGILTLAVTGAEMKTRYEFALADYRTMPEDEADQMTMAMLKTYSAATSELIRQLHVRNMPNMAKVKIIYLLGELRVLVATGVLIENINLTAERMDPKTRIARWGRHPAQEALVKIGPYASRMIMNIIGSPKFDEAKLDGYAAVLVVIESPRYALMKLQDRGAEAKDETLRGQCEAVVARIKTLYLGPVPDARMTKWGPKLSEEELAAIAKLSTTELVDMLKTGDTLHKFAALERLEANGGWKRNFDLLLSIAAERRGSGDMIVEGLVSATDESASAEDKCLVDKFLDFVEAELKKDKPSVSRYQAIRSIAQAVYRRRPLPTPTRTKLEIIKHTKPPYGYGRAINILTSCLYSKDSSVRADAIDALGSVGAQDMAMGNHIIAILETQLAKEETSEENKAVKKGMRKTIEHALRSLRRQLSGPKQMLYE